MRQLAAILFADMTGYTALMQENEQLARSNRRRLKEVLELAVSQYNGKILQNYGDGSLSIFNSAIDSVGCAIHIQQQLQKEPKVNLRIGIHTGDMIKAIVPAGKYKGTYIGTVSVRNRGMFKINGKINDVNWRHCRTLHKVDGYGYSYTY